MDLLRAEIAKLRRPLVFWALLGLVLVGASVGAAYLETAKLQYRNAIVAPTQAIQHPAPCKALGGLQPGPKCEAVRARDVELARQFLRETTNDSLRALSHLEPLGSGGFAAGIVTSTFGALVIMLLAGAHIGGEWTGHTAKTLFVQENRRGRVILAKFGSLWIGGVALLVGTWAGMAITGQLVARVFPIPLHPSPTLQWAYSWPQLARALLVIGAFAAVGTFSASIVRNTLGTFFLGFGIIVASMVLSAFDALFAWTPGYWVASWMGFERTQLSLDHIWPDVFGGPQNPAVGAVGLSLLLIGCLAASVSWIRRVDVA